VVAVASGVDPLEGVEYQPKEGLPRW